MTNPAYTHNVLVLDRSGSMSQWGDAPQKGFDALANSLGIGETVSVYMFDDQVERTVSFGRPPIQIPLRPRGMTALNDAVAYAIIDTGRDLSRLPEEKRPGRVLVTIFTDGGENRSIKYRDIAQLREMIDHQKSVYSWEFVFTGPEGSDSLSWIDKTGLTDTAYTFPASAQGVNATLLRTVNVRNLYAGGMSTVQAVAATAPENAPA